MLKPYDAREKYLFYDADEQEDSIIRQVIGGVQCSNLELGINAGALLLTGTIAGVLIKSMIQNGIKIAMLIVAVVLPGYFIYMSYRAIKKRLDSSGIHLPKQKEPHYIICRTSCTSKRFENHKYLISCRTHSGKTIENVLVTHGVYNYLSLQETVTVCLPDCDESCSCVGIPSQYFQRFKDSAEEKENISETKRDLRVGERELILEQYADRAKLRNKLFIRNNSILLIISILIAVLGYIKKSNGPLYLGAVATVLFAGTIITPFIEDRKFIKKLSNPETPVKILETTVTSVDTKTNRVAFSLPSVKEPVFVSEKPEVRYDFKEGTSALLVYIEEAVPVPFRKFKR